MSRKIVRELVLIFGLSLGLFVAGELIINLMPVFTPAPAMAIPKPVAAAPGGGEKIAISKEPLLMIPAVGISVPIVLTSSERENDVVADLKRGVSHRASSALPGEEGNVFLVGHSSNYPWEKGNYNRVFAHLGSLKAGDMAFVDFEDKRYAYTVTAKKVVSPSDLSVWAPTTGHNLSLMTCYPPGTTLKRLVVSFALQKTYE